MDLCEQLKNNLSLGEFDKILHFLRESSTNELLKSTLRDELFYLLDTIVAVFYDCTHRFYSHDPTSPDHDTSRQKFDEIIYECTRLLRNTCALGESVQNRIISAEISAETGRINAFDAITAILNDRVMLSQRSRKMCWQFVANLSVQNRNSQAQIWRILRDNVLQQVSCVCGTDNARECTMTLYNIFIGISISTECRVSLVSLLLACYDQVNVSHSLDSNDFHQIFMDHLICNDRGVVPVFAKLSSEKRLTFLFYVADHMKCANHEAIHASLLQFLCKEFKKKSDCVLKTANSYIDHVHPREVLALLDVIARASSDERYTYVLASDGSLFLNVGCLLQTINAIGKSTNNPNDVNIFTPVQKLEQLAPNSDDGCSIEREISFELKSMLVRTLGNLVYKNRKNQDMAREMDIILAVLDSTNLDARNPLIKEWSILAIRNLCENNFENQQIIQQLTKVGDANNSDVLKEFNIDLGSLRISPN